MKIHWKHYNIQYTYKYCKLFSTEVRDWCSRPAWNRSLGGAPDRLPRSEDASWISTCLFPCWRWLALVKNKNINIQVSCFVMQCTHNCMVSLSLCRKVTSVRNRKSFKQMIDIIWSLLSPMFIAYTWKTRKVFEQFFAKTGSYVNKLNIDMSLSLLKMISTR